MNQPWKHAIIVGASAGIGSALARQLVAGGCRVALIARREEELLRLKSELDTSAGTEMAIVAPHDVLDRAEVPALFQDITERLGGVDVIFYTAGVMPKVATVEYDTEKDALMMEVNTVGAMAWFNEAARRFARLGRGTIVGISSIAGDRGRTGNPAYCTSKAALDTYLEALRNRITRFGARVVTIKPGFVDTEMTQGLPGLFWLISAEEAARQIIEAARKGKRVAYVPARWGAVGLVIRNIPSFVFRRLNI
jgi:short-subunit dehydrogenase